MKKFALPLLAGLILSAVSFSFTGCDEPLVAPEDTWCEMDKTVLSTDVTLDFIYATSEKTITISSNKSVTIPAGFTVIVSAPVGVNNTALVNPYIIKTFKSGETEEIEAASTNADSGETTAATNFTFKATLWDALYIRFNKSGLKTVSDYPSILKDGTEVSDLTKIIEGASWKTILIDVLEMI